MLNEIDDILKSIHTQNSVNLLKEIDEVEKKIDYLANGGEKSSFNGLTHYPVFPEWFFTAKIGQPRQINYLQIRNFAQSPWVQMVLNSIKKQIMVIPWDLENVDPDDSQSYDSQKKAYKEFLLSIDEGEKNTIIDLASEAVTDIGEIDALSWVKVFSTDSYEMQEVPIEDDVGNIIGTEERPMLKPFGQRELVYVKSADPATFLRQIDIYKRDRAFYQYSWKNPRSSPIRFEPDEVCYNMMNKRSYKLYGFSPVQSIQQILELLIQSTRWNKDYFKNNAFPDGIISLPGANRDSMEMFKENWEKQVRGKPHKVVWHNTDAKFSAFNMSNKDMEWLNGQKWFFHLVFAVFGLSPEEAGFYENSNRSTQEGQERVSAKNAIKPFLTLIEETINRNITREFFQDKHPPIKFAFNPMDHQLEQIEFDQAMRELQQGTLTINEYRAMRGRDALPETSASNEEDNKASSLEESDDSKKKVSKLLKTPEVNPQEEAAAYEDFYVTTLEKWKKRIVNNLDKVEFQKTFPDFMKELMNTVKSYSFLSVVKKYIRSGMQEGIDIVKKETGEKISFSLAMESRLTTMENQQINGYKLPDGTVWPGIKGATKELQFEIIKSVEESIKNKESIEESAKKITALFDVNISRAKSIARTETTRFINVGKQESYTAIGMRYKYPNAVGDQSTSELCSRLYKKYKDNPVPVSEEYTDDLTGKRFLHPPHHVNCRCVLQGKQTK